MERQEFLRITPARPFFKKYVPQVKNFYHKLRGTDGNGKPITFSDDDLKYIQAGIKQYANDLKELRF